VRFQDARVPVDEGACRTSSIVRELGAMPVYRSRPTKKGQMQDVAKSPFLASVLYRVIVPVRGVAEGEHNSTLLPQGALLERLPDHSGVPLVRVRCNGRNCSVLEIDLQQWCETI
jgi:hypothetical protein